MNQIIKIFKIGKKIFIGIFLLLISLSIIGFSYEHVSQIISSNKFHPDGESITLGDHKLHFVKKGSGSPTVIFESGLDPGGHLPWFKVQNEISKYSTTISYDRNGILWSERGNNPKSGNAMMKELSELLKKTNCPKPYIVVGHSLAGLFLRNFIEENKADISGIIFVDVSHPEQDIRRPEKLKALSEFPPDYLVKLANMTGLIRLFYNKSYPGTSKNDTINLVTHALFYKSISGYLDEKNAMDTLLNEANKINSFDSISFDIITAISPDKYLSIEDEKLRTEFLEYKISLQKDLLKLSKNSKLIVTSDSGHFIQLEQPNIIINSIKKMIDKNKKNIK